MFREEAWDIIHQENLFQYNWFNDHPYQKNEVVIIQTQGEYAVFSTDQEGLPYGTKRYVSESEALFSFVYALRKLRDDLLKVYIEENYLTYYKNVFRYKPGNGLFLSFNPAGILPVIWLPYRKMWREAAIFFALLAIFYIALAEVKLAYISFSVISLAFFCFYGNALFLMSANRAIRDSYLQDKLDQKAYLKTNGGYSPVYGLLGITLYLAIMYLHLSELY